MEVKGLYRLKRRVMVKDLLSGLTASPNPPTSSLAYDRRSARVPVGCRGSGLRVWGFWEGLDIRDAITAVRTRLAKGAPRLHHPLVILVHDIPAENNPQHAQ